MQIALEKVCPECKGHKVQCDEDTIYKEVPCQACSGIGAIPTEAGEALLEFLAKFKTQTIKEAEHAKR